MALTQVPSTMIDRSLATIASATTTDLSTTTSENVSVTGTTTITSFGTLPAGALRYVTFAGILTLTHNATSLILPGAANITTAAGDVATLLSLDSGNWRCISYTKANGQAVAAPVIAYVGAGGQVFASSGTFTIPAGVTALKVTVVGGGGAGAGALGTNDRYFGYGGGAGGSAIKYLTGLTPGATLTVTVGLGGTGVSAANGNAGGTSSVASGTQTISTISATGGSGGLTYKEGAAPLGPVSGGSGSGGDFNSIGGFAGMGRVLLQNTCTTSIYQSGAGGAVGCNATQTSFNGTSFMTTKTPAAVGLYGGTGGYGLTDTSANGPAATGYGNGGGGALKISGLSTFAGGAGSGGVVIFEW